MKLLLFVFLFLLRYQKSLANWNHGLLALITNTETPSEIPFQTENLIIKVNDLSDKELPNFSNLRQKLRTSFTQDKSEFKCQDGEQKIFLDLSEESGILVNKSGTLTDFHKCFWVFKGTTENTNQIKQLQPKFSARLYTITLESNRTLLRDFYSISHGSPVITSLVEVWDGEGNMIRRADHVWQRRRNLQGHHFRGLYLNFGHGFGLFLLTHFSVAIFDYKPYTFLQEKTRLKSAYGFNIDLLKFMQRNLNFTFEFLHPTDGNFGQANKSGT